MHLASIGIFHPYRPPMRCNRACNHALGPIYYFYQLESNHGCWIISSHFQTRISNSGVAREYRAVSRRSRSTYLFTSAPLGKYQLPSRQPYEDAENISYRILPARMLGQTKQKSASMALDALSQANLRARQVGARQ